MQLTKLKKMNILVVEDNEAVNYLLKKILEKEGYQVDTAFHGEEMIKCFKRKKYDIIFTDIQMPIMDGITASRKIREIEKERNTIIIATSGIDTENAEVIIANEPSIDGFLSKPFSRATVIKTVLNTKIKNPKINP